MAIWLEHAPSRRAKCTICESSISTRELRVAAQGGTSTSSTVRFTHFDCAIDRDPKLAHDALVSSVTRPNVLEAAIAEVARRRPELGTLVHATLALQARTNAVTVHPLGTDETVSKLLEQLADAPEDRAMLGVLGDALLANGDERGELIALELAGVVESPDSDQAVLSRRRQLRAALTPVTDPRDTMTWGIGFIRRLEVSGATRVAEIEQILRHPSCQLLAELRLLPRGPSDVWSVPLAVNPSSLRRLHVVRAQFEASRNLSMLTRLEELSLAGCKKIVRLEHPTLRSLVLSMPSEQVLQACFPQALPNVTQLELDAYSVSGTKLVDYLRTSGWFAQLTELTLEKVNIEDHHIDQIGEGLAGRRLVRLDVKRSRVTRQGVRKLAALCETLLCAQMEPTPAAEPQWYEHTAMPELGRGRVVRRWDGKIEIAFASGPRTFKANAAFLRPCWD
ncbi:MAG: hypothetical protein AB7P03_18465 [Kofleriaceae bacterium]